MADISKITLPSGTSYDIKDTTARNNIANLNAGNVGYNFSNTYSNNTVGAALKNIDEDNFAIHQVIDNMDASTIPYDLLETDSIADVIEGIQTNIGNLQTGLTGAMHYIGISSTAITDNGTQKPTINSVQKTMTENDAGAVCIYGAKEYVWNGSKWQEFGSTGSLKALAFKDSASGTYVGTKSVAVTTKTTSNQTATVSPASSGTATYTPAGSVTIPAISLSSAGATTTIKNPTAKNLVNSISGYAPDATAPEGSTVNLCSVENETLILNKIIYMTTASITTSNVTVKTGDASYKAAQPIFSGTGVRLVTGNIPVPSEYTATITTENKTVTVS